MLLDSESLAIVHNLMVGDVRQLRYDERRTPFHPAHATPIAGLHDALSGDHRFYNNVFAGSWNGAALNNSLRMPCVG